MDLKKAIEELEALQLKRHAYEHAMGVLYLDAVTVAPSGTAEGRGRTMGVLSEESHRIFANEKTGELLDYLGDHLDELDLQTKREVEELNREYRQISRIPAEEYAAYSVLIKELIVIIVPLVFLYVQGYSGARRFLFAGLDRVAVRSR